MRLLAVLLLALPATAAAVPLNLANQGYLADSAGLALSGSHDLTFSLYDDDQATNPALWTETLTVSFVDGTYSVVLGEDQAIDEALLHQYPLFLGLSVDGGQELTPRYEVVSVPYSVLSSTSINVDGGTVNAISVAADTVTVGNTTIDTDGIQVGGTAVIDSTGGFVGTPPPPADLGCSVGQIMVWNGTSWACGDEQDGAFAGSPVAGVVSQDIDNWNAAFGWGDHAGAGYLQGDTADPPTAPISQADIATWNAAVATESDPVFAGSAAGGIAQTDVDAWNTVHTDWVANEVSWDAAYTRTDSDQGYTWVEWDAAYDLFDPADLPVPASISQTAITLWQSAVSDLGGFADLSTVQSITSTSTSAWDGAVSALGGFADLSTVQAIDSADTTAWNGAVSDLGGFSDLSTVQGIDSGDTTAWDGAVSDLGSFSDLSTVQGIDSGDTTAWNGAVSDLGGFSDLSTVQGIDSGDTTAWDGAVADLAGFVNLGVVQGIGSANTASWNDTVTELNTFADLASVQTIDAARIATWDAVHAAWTADGANWQATYEQWGTDDVIDFNPVLDPGDGNDASIGFSGGAGTGADWALVSQGEDLLLTEPEQSDKVYMTVHDDGDIDLTPGGGSGRVNVNGEAVVTGNQTCAAGQVMTGLTATGTVICSGFSAYQRTCSSAGCTTPACNAGDILVGCSQGSDPGDDADDVDPAPNFAARTCAKGSNDPAYTLRAFCLAVP